MTLRSEIHQVYERHPDHPFDALWSWATIPDGKRARLHRWNALENWAQDRREIAQKHGWDKVAWRYREAFQAYDKKRDWLKDHLDPKPGPVGDGWQNFDGHLVAGWMIREALSPARSSGAWGGVVFSGYRSPDYCRQLCIDMCGQPSCPGRCAGVSSNHCGPPSFKGNPYEGAVDVTDPYGLRRWCESHGNPIRGGGAILPYDTPHFSRAGN